MKQGIKNRPAFAVMIVIAILMSNPILPGASLAGGIPVFEELPLSDAILYKTCGEPCRTKGKHRIAIFVDPDCPYCRKLHQELDQLDAEVYIFLYPMTDLHPLSYRKSVSVWCSPDRIAALDTVMSGQPIPVRDCEHPVEHTLTLGARLGIWATPTLILEDGRRIEGYRPVKDLAGLLEIKGLDPHNPVVSPAEPKEEEKP